MTVLTATLPVLTATLPVLTATMEPLMDSRVTSRMFHVFRACRCAHVHRRREVWWWLCVEEARRRGLVRMPGVMRREEVSMGERCRLQLAVVLQANSRQIGSR
jgi:hypothetical protein